MRAVVPCRDFGLVDYMGTYDGWDWINDDKADYLVKRGLFTSEVEIPEDVEEEEQLNWIFDKYRDTHFCCEEKEIERVSTAIRFFDECERKGFNAADYQDTVFHACSELDEGDRETLKWWEFMLENVYQEDEQTSEYPDFW